MDKDIKLIGASKVFVCNEAFGILSEGALSFETSKNGSNHIIEVGYFKDLKPKYPNAEFYKDAIILPAFINAHIHFEFGNNISSFVYGGFDKWLTSVMQKRDEVLCDINSSIKSSIQEQLLSGVGSVGAISSYGSDLTLLANSPLRVVYFNEAIGSIPSAIDFLYQNFLARFEASKNLTSHKFTPAIALHSPYSVHKVLAKKILEWVKKHSCILSTHFLESLQEKQWLENATGWFERFYKETLKIPSPTPMYSSPKDFLELFEEHQTLFTHCLFANEQELSKIAKNSFVISCPRSNRLLSNTYLDLDLLESSGLKPIFATDGKSSNNNLNMLDELRSALFAYPHRDIDELSKSIILGATIYPAKALRLNNGSLEVGKYADISVFDCPEISKSSQPQLQFLLHSHQVKSIFIDGIKAI